MEYFPAILCTDERFMKSGKEMYAKIRGAGGFFLEIACEGLHVVWRAVRDGEDRK
jgi:hypothetical protein